MTLLKTILNRGINLNDAAKDNIDMSVNMNIEMRMKMNNITEESLNKAIEALEKMIKESDDRGWKKPAYKHRLEPLPGSLIKELIAEELNSEVKDE